MQGGGAAVEGDAVGGAAVFGKVFFELDDVGAQAKGAIINGFGDGGVEFRTQGFNLRL